MSIYGCEPLIVSCHPVKFGRHRYCGSGYILFLALEEQDLNSLLPFTSKANDMKARGKLCSDIGRTPQKQRRKKNTQKTFISSFKTRAK